MVLDVEDSLVNVIQGGKFGLLLANKRRPTDLIGMLVDNDTLDYISYPPRFTHPAP